MDTDTTPGYWPDASGPWRFHLHWAKIDGRMECVGIDFRSGPSTSDMRMGDPTPPTALTTSVLRSIPLASIVQDTKTSQAQFLAAMADSSLNLDGGDESREHLRRLASAHAAPTGGVGRRPLPADHYADVAAVYLSAPTKPTRAVASRYKVPLSTAGTWVARCREMGLVEPTTRGKSSGATAAVVAGKPKPAPSSTPRKRTTKGTK